MSRKIEAKASVVISEEEQRSLNTAAGKLLFTSIQGRQCAMVIEKDRLVEAAFLNPGKVGAVYIGKIKNMAKNIDACFVEIPKGEICFLPLKNAESPFLVNRIYDGRILEGDELLVQVARDAQKSKRASVTAHISLANEYFVLSLGSAKIGYSTKLSPKVKDAIRKEFTEKALAQNGFLIQNIGTLLSIPEADRMKAQGIKPESIPLPSVGLVVRTKAEELGAEELWNQFYSISGQFVRLLYTAMHRSCFSCLRKAPAEFEAMVQQFAGEDAELKVSLSDEELPPYSEPSPCRREIVTDHEALYEQLQEYCSAHRYSLPVRLYRDSMLSLSTLYSLESRLESALSRRVWLKCGGSLIIENTEALTVIDVNSGKCEVGADAGKAYQKINLEAAEEVARQLRLRNLSGIIIVDFINMQSAGDNRKLLQYMRELTARDGVPTKVVDITALGLVEITRQKINKPLSEQYHLT